MRLGIASDCGRTSHTVVSTFFRGNGNAADRTSVADTRATLQPSTLLLSGQTGGRPRVGGLCLLHYFYPTLKGAQVQRQHDAGLQCRL